MAKVDVKNLDGKTVGSVDLDESVFGAEVNEHLLWEVVKWQRAKSRVGTHSTKRRSEVSGGGKKPWKQKGTGGARQGSTRAPHFVGGGSAFGPKPRDYEHGANKKAVAGALRSALSLRAKEQKLVVLDGFALDAPKTASVHKAIATFGAKKALFVDGANHALLLSTRNLQNAKFLRHDGLNVYDVLDHDTLIVTKVTLEAVTARLKTEKKSRKSAQGAA